MMEGRGRGLLLLLLLLLLLVVVLVMLLLSYAGRLLGPCPGKQTAAGIGSGGRRIHRPGRWCRLGPDKGCCSSHRWCVWFLLQQQTVVSAKNSFLKHQYCIVEIMDFTLLYP
uniref:Uncharacterized protein n=1 Tax=Anopheles braziliensis TaxID=58242 RepID=A0A2M3ZLC3_9DIPT